MKKERHEIEKELRKQRKRLMMSNNGLVDNDRGPRTRPFTNDLLKNHVKAAKGGTIHPKHVVCPLVEKWSSELAAGVTIQDEQTKIPLPGGDSLVSCPSGTVGNAGQLDLVIPPPLVLNDPVVGATIWLYPDGARVGGAANTTFTPQGVSVGPSRRAVVGANVSPEDTDYEACAGYFAFGTAGDLANDTFAAPQPTQTRPVLGVPMDPLFTIQQPNKQSDLMNRTVKFSIKVSLISELRNTRGGIRMYCPNYWPGAAEYVPGTGGGLYASLASARRDPSYVDYPFSNKRTRTLTFVPNCDSIRYGPVAAIVPANVSLYDARFVLQLYGLAEGDTVLLQYSWLQEYTGSAPNAIATHSPITTDLVHLSNALPKLTNFPVAGKPPPTLTEHVATEKVKASPASNSMASAKGIDLNDVHETAKHAASIFSDALDVFGPIAALL